MISNLSSKKVVPTWLGNNIFIAGYPNLHSPAVFLQLTVSCNTLGRLERWGERQRKTKEVL